MGDKRPDNVVFNEEENRYDAALKPYATNVGAPKIETVDTVAWKNRNLQLVNAEFETRYVELKEAYEKLAIEFRDNEMVYASKFSFEPIVGHVYHLYVNKQNKNFLSIISPNECNFKFVGSFKLNADKIWKRLL